MRSRPHARGRGRDGFTLIEIALALLVFTLGAVVVFALFPESLELSRRSVEDTHVSLFAHSVMEGIRANAAGIEQWSEWDDPGFANGVTTGVYPPVIPNSETNQMLYPTTDPQKEQWLRYQLTIENDGAIRKAVMLDVDSGRYGQFEPQRFYTELYYYGNPSL